MFLVVLLVKNVPHSIIRKNFARKKTTEVIRVNIDDDQFAGSCGGRANSRKNSDLGTGKRQ